MFSTPVPRRGNLEHDGILDASTWRPQPAALVCRGCLSRVAYRHASKLWSVRPAGNSCSAFFGSIAHVDLTETQGLDLWEQALARKRELSESIGKKVALQAALVDVLASANLLRLPILMEYEELRKLQINAATDPLTGLYNRRFFDDYFEKELNRSIRYSHRLALVVFDLHRFKEVNDRYGHPQGDVLLQMAAATLRKSLRTSDYAFRIGGDEFALLLPQSDTEQAAALSRRLRAAYAVCHRAPAIGRSPGA